MLAERYLIFGEGASLAQQVMSMLIISSRPVHGMFEEFTLSLQRTDIAPRFWTESSRFTIAFILDKT